MNRYGGIDQAFYYRWNAVCGESRTCGVDLNEIPIGIVRDDDLLEIFLTEFDIEMSDVDVEAVVDEYGLNIYNQPPNGVPNEVVIITFSEENPYDYQDDLGALELPYPMIVLFLEEEGGEGYLMDMVYEELHYYEYGDPFSDIFDDLYIQETFQELKDTILNYNTDGLRVLGDASETNGVIAFTYEVGDQPDANLLLVLFPIDEGEEEKIVGFGVIHPGSLFVLAQ